VPSKPPPEEPPEASISQVPSDPPQKRIRPAWKALAAFGVYLALSIAIWGLPVISHLSTRYVGLGQGDAKFYRWALGWLPWAMTHGRDVLFSDRIFAPSGADLSWSAAMPGAAFVLWPVTRLFGPLASYNLSLLLAPPLAGWAAYLVCHRVTKAYWPSLVGGYLFGFSSFMTGQIHGHANLVLIFPVALAVYLVVRSVEGSLGRWMFVGLLTLALVGLFLVSTELFATSAMFGAFAFLGAIAVGGKLRRPMLRTVVWTALAYVLTGGILLFPYILPVLRQAPDRAVRPTEKASVDALGFVVPRKDLLVGGERFEDVSDPFTAGLVEDAGYVGLGLVAVLLAFAVTERRHPETWALLAFVLVGSLLALGPVLHVGGEPSSRLPGTVLTGVPLLKNATPQRFPAYTALAVGVIAAIWLARARGPWRWAQWALVLVGALMLLPSVRTPPWHPTDDTPTFFTTGTYRSWLHPDEIVLAIPETSHGEMAWQSSADYWFRMPQGYVGILPPNLGPDALYGGLTHLMSRGRWIPPPDVFASWLTDHDVTAVVVSEPTRAYLAPVLRDVGLQSVYQGEGVSVWRSPEGS
jgi:hypothetical protein